MSYKTEELVSSSEITKNFDKYMSKLSSGDLEKIAVLKNNKIQAVIISPKIYEQMQDFLEHMEIAEIIKNRTRENDFANMSEKESLKAIENWEVLILNPNGEEITDKLLEKNLWSKLEDIEIENNRDKLQKDI